MEIHPPRHVGSLKDFFKELLTITIGILIALSLEGLLEWHHHRDVAREARENIMSELRENRRELANEEQDLRKMQQQTQGLLEAVHRIQTNLHSKPQQVQLMWSLAQLHSTSWEAATRTGAISYMPYGEVQRYTVVYDLQRTFSDLQQRSFAAALEVEGLATLTDRKQDTLTSQELADAERRVGVARATINAMQSIAQPLRERYDQVLKEIGER